MINNNIYSHIKQMLCCLRKIKYCVYHLEICWWIWKSANMIWFKMHYNTIQAGHRLGLSASCWSTNHEFETRFCYYDYILYIKRKTNTFFLKVFFSIYYHLICCWEIQLKRRSWYFLPFYCVILLNIRKIVDDYTCTMYTFQD